MQSKLVRLSPLSNEESDSGDSTICGDAMDEFKILGDAIDESAILGEEIVELTICEDIGEWSRIMEEQPIWEDDPGPTQPLPWGDGMDEHTAWGGWLDIWDVV